MSFVASMATEALTALITGGAGVAGRLIGRLEDTGAQLTLFPPPEVERGHFALDLWERARGARYPQMTVYCERIQNLQTEKFRRFSGVVQMAVEVRNSQDRIEGLEERTHLYVESLLEVLEDCRGEWRSGVYYCGKYEVKYEPVKHGGKNFVQVAKVMLPLEVNIA
ncbi:MAG: hypothetical protein R2762_10385 [Bryobacteraceae bacterium]